MIADSVATNLSAAASTLSTVDRRLPLLEGSASAFGGDGGGLPGRLGRRLHAHWSAVLEARAREAADTAARLAELAESVRVTQRDYVESDESAARRIKRAG
ncbi:hypothetical protein AB0M54_11585 [Actinoplanes sp. NPDC051470]|uniref:hypothetical protein n=1 Tax=unclassified Actinoplanes TaxID=2626549 RepID=UPI003440DC46